VRLKLATAPKPGTRPDGYFVEIFAAGKIEGEDLVLDDHIYMQLVAKYTPTSTIAQPVPEEVATALQNVPEILHDWMAAGSPLRTKEAHAQLKQICDLCPDHHCRTRCHRTPYLRWLTTVTQTGPSCLWPSASDESTCKTPSAALK
jgi:hypothetical protein